MVSACLSENARVSLLFFWKELARQVHITGTADKVSTSESMRYFASRARGSQLGAWVSQQSSIISSRQLLTKFEELKAKFRRSEVPLSGFWGGSRVHPDTFEFWQGRENRLHNHRFLYTHHSAEWTIQRLAP